MRNLDGPKDKMPNGEPVNLSTLLTELRGICARKSEQIKTLRDYDCEAYLSKQLEKAGLTGNK
jgi:hypothetical protein